MPGNSGRTECFEDKDKKQYRKKYRKRVKFREIKGLGK